LAWTVEFGGSVRHVGERYLFPDDATTLLAYKTADASTFVDIPGRDLFAARKSRTCVLAFACGT
jgi:iron complex outermembrane receptor protein